MDNLSLESLEYMTTVIKARQDPVWFIEEILKTPMFPKQAEITRAFYKHKYLGQVSPAYKKLVLGLGMRSGKTALGGMLSCYEFFDICSLENPSEYYGLLKGQPIFIPVIAPSERQVTDGIFFNVQNMLEGSEWVQSWTDWKVKTEEIVSPSKHVVIKPFSSWANTGRGTTSKAVFFDEMDLFAETTSKLGAQEVYAAISKATATLGMDGHIFVLSSLMSSTSITSTLLAKGKYEDTTLTYKLPTWEVNPNIKKEQLMEEFKFDMPTFWRDYGCEPSMWSGVAFPDGVILKQQKNVLDYPIQVPANRKMRVMAIDPAVKNDSFGVAVGWRNDDGIIHVDGVTKFTRQDGEVIIKPSVIRNYIKEATSVLSIYALVHDTWMFPDIIEMAHDMGMTTEQHIVKKVDYDLIRSMMCEGKLEVVYNQDLKLEMEQLVIKGGAKPNVDHPLNGSKDVADCVANVVWYLTNKAPMDLNPHFLMARTF